MIAARIDGRSMTKPTEPATPPAFHQKGFDDLGLAAPILAAVRDVGYERPSPIQLAAIPPLLEGKDVLGQAQTGTGKTAAFALPLLSRLDLKLAQPQLLVLTPTRELAIQVAEAMQTYARHLKGFHVLPVYGGQGMDFQLKQLRRGVHAVVGTPGRIQDHLRRKTLKLDRLRAVVLDEADEMKIKDKTATVTSVDQRFVEVRGFDKLEALTRIIEVEDFDAMLIFVRTRMATTELAEKLEARGLASAALSGEMTQQLRERTIERLKSGKLDIVVATDVAARGLDVERITHVVNYDVPHDVEGYIHRIGRTGRAGRKGNAILFVMPRELRMLAAIERATRQQVRPMDLPTRADVVDRRALQFKQTITDVLGAQDLGFFTALVDSYEREHAKSPREIAAALAYLAQKDRPLQPPPDTVRRDKPRHDKPPHDRPRHEQARDDAPRGKSAARAAKPPGKERARSGAPASGQVRYRLEVGHAHGVQPGNIVGAIANEAGIDSAHIGRIEIFDEYSTVDLPEGMPKEVYNQLRKAWVCGQKLEISIPGGPKVSATRPPRAR